MKKILIIPLLFLIVGCVNNKESSSVSDDSNINSSTSIVSEGKLYIKNVEQYYSYAPVDVPIYINKIPTSDIDLYYDIMDPEICEIKDNKIYGLKVGTTTVYAQTILGQEVSFTVRIKEQTEYIYDRDVRSREEHWNIAGNPKNNTLFIGDSFFDKYNFWKEFEEDFRDKNCFTMGISGSKTNDWLMAREKLINPVEPKNIVIHIGTNDINDVSLKRDVEDYYYDLITLFNKISEENPNANLYYFGIENRVGVNYDGANMLSTKVTEKVRDEYAKENSKFTYLDSPSVFNNNQSKYMSSDTVHPSREGYLYYIDVLNEVLEY